MSNPKLLRIKLKTRIHNEAPSALFLLDLSTPFEENLALMKEALGLTDDRIPHTIDHAAYRGNEYFRDEDVVYLDAVSKYTVSMGDETYVVDTLGEAAARPEAVQIFSGTCQTPRPSTEDMNSKFCLFDISSRQLVDVFNTKQEAIDFAKRPGPAGIRLRLVTPQDQKPCTEDFKFLLK